MCQTIIVASGKVDVTWLCEHLGCLWFGGEHSIVFNPTTLDIYPVRYTSRGHRWAALA